MTSAENSFSEPPNLKIFWERIPPHTPTRLVTSALAIMHPPPPLTEKPSYGPGAGISLVKLNEMVGKSIISVRKKAQEG